MSMVRKQVEGLEWRRCVQVGRNSDDDDDGDNDDDARGTMTEDAVE